MKSIQSKFLTLIISGLLILSLAIGSTCLIFISSVLEENSDIITESVSQTEALRINDTLGEIEASVKIMESYIMSSFDSAESLMDEDYRIAHNAVMKEVFSDIAKNTPGAVAFYLRYNPEITTSTAGFFVAMSAGGKETKEYPTTPLVDWENAPYEDVCWYSEPVTAGKAVWIDPYHQKTIDDVGFSYVIPFYKNHKLCGIVGMSIDFSIIESIVADISVYDNGFAYLTDKNGNICYSPVDDHQLSIADRDHGFAEEQMALDNGMRLVIHADYSDIQHESYRLMTLIVLISFLILVGFIIITYILTKKIVTPLRRLADSAEHLVDGDIDIDKECDTGDEVGVLARTFKDTSEKLRGYVNYINDLAYRDSLTGIKNRTAYNESVVQIEKDLHFNKAKLKFGVLVADINMLKQTNDNYGHEIGNQLIIRAAKIICDIFKHSPVFRIGGDEFVILLENEDYENRNELILAMDKRCADSFVEVENEKIPISIARGVSEYDHNLDSSFEDVFYRADQNMYTDKQLKRKVIDSIDDSK